MRKSLKSQKEDTIKNLSCQPFDKLRVDTELMKYQGQSWDEYLDGLLQRIEKFNEEIQINMMRNLIVAYRKEGDSKEYGR